MDSEYTKHRGIVYCDKPPFNMAQAMLESDCSIPLFFVLFPGVEPTGYIRSVGQKYNKSIGNNTLIEISMGQGGRSAQTRRSFRTRRTVTGSRPITSTS